MKTLTRYWYLVLLILLVFLVNEYLVQWALAVWFGGYTVAGGLARVWRTFELPAFLILLVSRFVPYAVLGGVLVGLSEGESRDYVVPVLLGGVLGISATVFGLSWVILRPLYTDEHMRSTAAIGLLFIPFYAVPVGIAGAALSVAAYRHGRTLAIRRALRPPK